MQKYVYVCGLCHPASDLTFVGLESVWSFVKYLQTSNRFRDVVCCTPSGDILNPPYDNSQIPGIIEEIVNDYNNPRRWILHRESEIKQLHHMIDCMDQLFGGRDFYGSDEIAAILAGNGITSNVEASASIIARYLGVSDFESFVSYVTHQVTEYST